MVRKNSKPDGMESVFQNQKNLKIPHMLGG